MNYLSYTEQNFLFPSLFIGMLYWPIYVDDDEFMEDEDHTKKVLSSLDLPEYIILTPHQTGSFVCNQLKLFGVFYMLPKDDPLIVTAISKSRDCFDATWNDLVSWSEELKKFGLGMAQNHYEKFQEAFVPLDECDAFEYARRNALGIWTCDRKLVPVDTIKSVSELEDLLFQASKKIDEAFSPVTPVYDSVIRIVIDTIGAIVYENRD